MELIRPYKKRNTGFTLLESMIALVIFSVALLALAGMYMKTLSLSHSSYLRALASIQAMDLEERIRANPNATAGNYAFNCGGNTAADAIGLADPAGFPGAYGGGPANLAADDAADWCGHTHAVFGGLLQTATVAAAGTDLTISIQWNERAIAADNDVSVASSTFTYTVRK